MTTAGPGDALKTSRQWMDLKTRCACCDGRAHFEHVRAENSRCSRTQVVGVVLHERRASWQPLAHHLYQSKQHSGLPVTLSTEAVTLGHQALHGNAW